MPNKNSKNCIINAELTDCQWDKNLIGQKFSAFVEMIIEKKSNQALANKPRNNKTSNKAPKQPAWFAAFRQEFNQKITNLEQQIQITNQKVDQFKQEVKQEIAEIKQQIQATNQKVDLLEQKVDRGFKQVNARIDNLVAKNKLIE